jgi:hypothetical protein
MIEIIDQRSPYTAARVQKPQLSSRSVMQRVIRELPVIMCCALMYGCGLDTTVPDDEQSVGIDDDDNADIGDEQDGLDDEGDPQAVGTSSEERGAADALDAEAEGAADLLGVNVGLSVAQASNVQCWLQQFWGYPGPIDGDLGTNSWKAMQRFLRTHWGYTGAIDGVVGGGTVAALQRFLRVWGYTGPIDGIIGNGTRAAFRNFANAFGSCLTGASAKVSASGEPSGTH